MGQVRLRFAGLYFNEVVDMPGPGPWTVREVMDNYVMANPITQTPIAAGAKPRLSYDVQAGVGKFRDLSVLSVTVEHAPSLQDAAQLEFKFYTYNAAAKTFTQNTGLNGNTQGNKRRRPGVYHLQETPLDGGAIIVAWQYYINADGGSGVLRSETRPDPKNDGQLGFDNYDGPKADCQAGDVILWRMVAIRRGPLELLEAPKSSGQP